MPHRRRPARLGGEGRASTQDDAALAGNQVIGMIKSRDSDSRACSRPRAEHSLLGYALDEERQRFRGFHSGGRDFLGGRRIVPSLRFFNVVEGDHDEALR